MQLGQLNVSQIFFFAMIGACLLGILCKLIAGMICRKLLKETENIANTKNRMLKQLKLKFENCYRLNYGVSNTNIFVDKYLFHHRICGLTVHQWSKSVIFWMLLCVLLGISGGIYTLYEESSIEKMLLLFLVGLAGAVLLIIVDSMGAIETRIDMMTVNMQDYLENYLTARLVQSDKSEEEENSVSMKQELEQMKESLKRMEEMFVGKVQQKQQQERAAKERQDKENDLVIQEVIQEFLT